MTAPALGPTPALDEQVGKQGRPAVPFEARIAEGENGCRMWTGARSPKGYGHYWDGTKVAKAHRHAWTVRHGPIPAGMQVLHRCDCPPCVNLEHLFLGTNADNVADRMAKGRHRGGSGDRHGSKTHPERLARGERNGSVKLSVDQVREIRLKWTTGKFRLRDLADQYGVVFSNIANIVHGRTWRML